MSKIDQLIEVFKEFKEELNKNVNMSYSGAPNSAMSIGKSAATIDAVAMSEKDIKGVHVGSNPNEPGRSSMGLMTRLGESGKAKQQAKATLKEIKSIKPKMIKAEKLSVAGNGQWSLHKDEGTNEEARPTKPHNKGEFKVMPMIEEKSSKKEEVKGKPYSGLDKAEKCPECKEELCKCK